jgi:hypothetical protein
MAKVYFEVISFQVSECSLFLLKIEEFIVNP